MFETALQAAPVVEEAVESVNDMGIVDATVTAVLGYAFVFVGLLILMIAIAIFGKVMAGKKAEKAEEKAPEAAPAAAPAPAPAPVAAPVTVSAEVGMKDGSRACDLYNVDDKTAVMLMAIVADEAGIPLNELRFISIKEL